MLCRCKSVVWKPITLQIGLPYCTDSGRSLLILLYLFTVLKMFLIKRWIFTLNIFSRFMGAANIGVSDVMSWFIWTPYNQIVIKINYNKSQQIFQLSTVLNWTFLPFEKPFLGLTLDKLKSESKLCYDRMPIGQSVLVSSTHIRLKTRFLFLSGSFGFVWREDGSLFYNV
jgi:hypothetical protein